MIDGVAGDTTASTVNGTAHIQNAAGNLKISSVNGQIEGSLSRLGPGQTVSLDAVNGRIELGVPEDANANFSVSTLNGGISSEFPSLEVTKEFPVSKNLKGSLGSGGASVKITTVNGSVSIKKLEATK
jgi:DUF4097 and DUF4098 domain-containing protein YvlB